MVCLGGLSGGLGLGLTQSVVEPVGSRAGAAGGELAAADVELTADVLAEIQAAATAIQVQGGRYSEQAEKMTNL